MSNLKILNEEFDKCELEERIALDWKNFYQKDKNGTFGMKEMEMYMKQRHLFETDMKKVVALSPTLISISTGEEFAKFYKLLIPLKFEAEIFARFTKNGIFMSAEEFQTFLKESQNLPLDDPQIQELQKKVFALYKCQKGLDVKNFVNYLLSKRNTLNMDELFPVLHDMTLPLQNYYISSSHNSYLLGDQFKSKSSVENYAKILLSGCRCVELDMWDGSDGDPIIYHGHTLTSSIKFSDVIKAIKQSAFVASPYPVILSFENHCSLPQQEKMAEILKEQLGDSLLIADVKEFKHLPSPHDLQYKIIIKNKTLETTNSEAPNVAPSLSDLVNFCAAIKFNQSNFRSSTKVPFYMMSSLNETKGLKLMKTYGRRFIEYHKKHNSRIYPKGTRIDSSNYNPVPFWNAGCQMVALNYQTYDTPMQLQNAKFRQNNGYGYILKPKLLRSNQKLTFDPNNISKTESILFSLKKNNLETTYFDHTQAHLTIIYGQNFPVTRRKNDGLFVRVMIIGLPLDSDVLTTSPVEECYSPVWRHKFQFDVTVPEMALLRFEVCYSSGIRIRHFTIPFQNVAQGYHYVWLYGNDSEEKKPSSLFIHFETKPYDSDTLVESSSSDLQKKPMLQKDCRRRAVSTNSMGLESKAKNLIKQTSFAFQPRRDAMSETNLIKDAQKVLNQFDSLTREGHSKSVSDFGLVKQEVTEKAILELAAKDNEETNSEEDVNSDDESSSVSSDFTDLTRQSSTASSGSYDSKISEDSDSEGDEEMILQVRKSIQLKRQNSQMVRNAKIAEDKLLEDGEENIVYDQEDEVLQETAVVSKLRKESQQLSRAGSYILSVSKRSSLDENRDSEETRNSEESFS